MRYGGPDSVYKITNATQTSPIVITAPGHKFRDGDVVYISMVRGNLAANGPRQVQGVSGNSFQLLSIDGNPVSASGQYDGNGTVGLARPTLVAAGPRVLLDGPGGVLTARVKDPDGPGGARAPAAQNLAYSALLRRYDTRFKNPGATEALSGDSVLAAAIGWYIDNSNSLYLQTARNWINNVEKLLGFQSASPFFGTCNEQVINCGSASGSYLDWGGFWAANWAMGYQLVRSELSEGERRMFAAKMLNGMNGDSCDNRLIQGGGTVTLTQGSKVVQGNGTDFRSIPSPAGRWFQIKGGKIYGTWGVIDSVVSETEMLLKDAAPISGDTQPWWWENDWTARSCGYFWWISHHGYTPPVLTREAQTNLAQATSAEATELPVVNGAAFPQRTPFYARLGTEWIKVLRIEQNVLKVERGLFSSVAKSNPLRAPITSSDFPPSGGTGSLSPTTSVPFDSPQHNLSFSKVYSTIVVALALLDDDPRAAPLLEATWNYWFDYFYPFSKSRWAGVTQGGYSYGPPRWQSWTYTIAVIGATSFTPKIDIADGNWLKNFLVYPAFGMLPWNSKRAVMYGDSGSVDSIASRWYWHIYMANYLYGDSPEFAYANYWLRRLNNWFSVNELQSPSGFNSIPYALIFVPPDSDCPSTTPGRLCTNPAEALDPHYFFTTPDYRPPDKPENAFGVVVSRQNWKPDSTYVWMQAMGMDIGDHLGAYATPGSYRIARGQWLMASGPYTLDAGALNLGNYVEVDGTGGIALPPAVANSSGTVGVIASVDRQFGNGQYTFWRVNSNYAFKAKTAIARHYRSFLHMKTGTQDYVLVYDDVATASPKQKLMRLHYYADNSEKGTLERNQSSIVYTRSQSRVSTQVLLPSAPEKLSESTAAYANNRSNVVTVTVNDGPTEASEFLVVHRTSTSINDTMPPVRLITTAGPGLTGVLIEDPEAPRLALFSRNGSIDLTSASVTLPGLPAAAQMVVTGLSPGSYELKRNGAVLSGDVTVGVDGTFATTADSGATYELLQTRALSRPLRIKAATQLPDAQRSKRYSFQLTATGGIVPYVWSYLSGELPEGLSISPLGLIEGVPSVEGTFSFSAGVTDLSQPSETAEAPFLLTVTPAAEEPLRILTESLPDAIVGEPYDVQLEATGGVGPYRWAAIGDLPEGLALSEEGLLSGTPLSPQEEEPLLMECYDQSSPANIATGSFILTILSSAPPPPV